LLDTVELLLRTMEVEEAPPTYMEELRQIARRSDAQLLPPPRFVLIGAPLGEMPEPHFTSRPASPEEFEPRENPTVPAVPEPAAPPSIAHLEQPNRGISVENGYEFPPIDPPPAPPVAAAPTRPPPSADPFGLPLDAPPTFTPGLPFGAPLPPDPTFAPPPVVPPPLSAFGAPFAVTGEAPAAFGVPPEGVPPSSSWEWEPPEPPAV